MATRGSRSGILALLFFASTAVADIEATPEDNQALTIVIGGTFGTHVAGSIAGLVPAPLWISIPGEAVALSSDIALKGTPPVFDRLPNKVIDKSVDDCTASFQLDIVEAERKNIMGVTFRQTPSQNRAISLGLDQRDWLPLAAPGEMRVFHLNSDVLVSVSNPAIQPAPNPATNVFGNSVCEDQLWFNDDACFDVELNEGIHPFHWQAETQFNLLSDVALPSALVAFMVYSEVKKAKEIRKINQNGDILEEIINNPLNERYIDPAVADEIRLDLARKLLKLTENPNFRQIMGGGLLTFVAEEGAAAFIDNRTNSISIARNSFTQQVTVYDTHPPTISTSEAVKDLDATDFGGTRFARVVDEAVASLDYSDACRPASDLRLTHNAPNILPLGTSTVRWTVTDVPAGVDPAAFYAQGYDHEAWVEVTYNVVDRFPPILVAPDGKVIVSSAPTVDPSGIDLGRPRVIDLADPAPTVTNDAPVEFDVDSRIAINWTATDASDNSVTRVQWLTAKSPNSNTPPAIEDVTAQTLTAEPVTIRLEGTDVDRLPTNRGMPIVDPLSFEIAEYPANGEFEAPLEPFFIDDFRLTPLGETEQDGVRTSPLGANAADFAALPDAASRADFLDDAYCDQGNPVPVGFAYEPTYVHVADSGFYYVRDSFWECTGLLGRGTPAERERISKWTEERAFVRHYQLRGGIVGITHSDIFTVDENEQIWWSVYGLLGNVLGLQRLNRNLDDIRRLVFVPLPGGDGRAWRNAHGDPRTGLVFVNDNRGIAVFRAGNLAVSGSLGDFLLDVNYVENVGRLTVGGNPLFLDGSDCGLERDRKFWMATDSESNLYVAEACEDRIHKFGPSRLNADGAFVAGPYVGWMGRCSANVVPWTGCNEETDTSRGYACDDSKCLRGATAGTMPGQFNQPIHLAVDPRDALYVADYGNLRVQRFGTDGSFAGQAVSDGSGINTGDNPGFVLGNIGMPRAVALNSSTLFVMQSEANFDYFLHSFKTVPFAPIDAQGQGRDADGDGYEDNAVTITYVPRFDFPGSTGQPVAQDTFRYRVSDGLDDSPAATATITVSRNFRPPEDLEVHCHPVSDPSRRVGCELAEDTELLIEFIAVDPDGIVGFDGLDSLAYTPIQPANGGLTPQSADAATATYRYTPDADFNGTDTFGFTVTDGTTTDDQGLVEVRADFELEVTPVPDPPVLTVNTPPVAGRGFPALVTADYTDVDDDPDEAPPALSIDWQDGPVEPQGEIIEGADGQLTLTGPLLTPMTPSRGFVQGNHVFGTNGVRTVTVCLQPSDGTGTVCQDRAVDVVEATKVTVDVNPVQPAALPPEQAQVFAVEVMNVAPEGWAGIDATAVELVIDAPANLLPATAPANCNWTRTSLRIRCDLGDLAPGDTVVLHVGMTVNPWIPPVADINVLAAVIHQSLDISAEIEDSSVVLIDWPDSDADDLPDRWELHYYGDVHSAGRDSDDDGDGLTNYTEYQSGSDPRLGDTDEDGVIDYDEVNVHLTDPNSADTDADGLPDLWEIEWDVDPTSAGDSLEDHDEDGLITFDEFAAGTDPRNPDTDADEWLDGADNCPVTENSRQEEVDGDGVGLACDDYVIADVDAQVLAGTSGKTAIAALKMRRTTGDATSSTWTEVEVIDAAAGKLLGIIEPFDGGAVTHGLTPLPALNSIGIAGTHANGRIEIAIANLATGQFQKSLLPLGPEWRYVDTSHQDLSIATLGENRADGTVAADIGSATSNQMHRIEFFAGLGPAPEAERVVLLGNASQQVVAAAGRDGTTGTTLIQSRDRNGGALVSDVALLDGDWALADLAVFDAANLEVAALMTHASTGDSTILIVDLGSGVMTRQLATGIPSNSDRFAVAIRTLQFDGRAALALLVTNPSDADARIEVLDPVTGAHLATSASVSPRDHYRRSLTVLPAASGTDAPGLVAAFENSTVDRHALSIFDLHPTGGTRRIFLDESILAAPKSGSGAVSVLELILLWMLLVWVGTARRRT